MSWAGLWTWIRLSLPTHWEAGCDRVRSATPALLFGFALGPQSASRLRRVLAST